jgi:hypothetical protein
MSAEIDINRFSYYYTLRNKSRETVRNALNNRIQKEGGLDSWNRLTLCSIDQKSLDYARREWPKHYSESTHLGFEHSWEKLFHRFAHNPAHFDLAIWQVVDEKHVLQGMALGRPSRGKRNLSINWIERSYEPTYFKGGVLLPILACAEEYAKLLGSERVHVKNAVDPEVFIKYGYVPFGTPKHKGLCKELKP